MGDLLIFAAAIGAVAIGWSAERESHRVERTHLRRRVLELERALELADSVTATQRLMHAVVSPRVNLLPSVDGEIGDGRIP